MLRPTSPTGCTPPGPTTFLVYVRPGRPTAPPLWVVGVAPHGGCSRRPCGIITATIRLLASCLYRPGRHGRGTPRPDLASPDRPRRRLRAGRLRRGVALGAGVLRARVPRGGGGERHLRRAGRCARAHRPEAVGGRGHAVHVRAGGLGEEPVPPRWPAPGRAVPRPGV